jgi:hypothetical protein
VAKLLGTNIPNKEEISQNKDLRYLIIKLNAKEIF